MKFNLQVSTSSLFFCGFLFVAQFINGFTNARSGYSDVSNVWYSLAFYWALGWFLNDSRKHGTQRVDKYMDMGMFLYLGWIFFVPYYLLKTHGWKALYTVGLFLGTFVGAYIAGAILFFITGIF
jgi:hypothetical protein